MLHTFSYLDVEMNKNGNIHSEINKRLMAGNKAYYANIKLFTSSLLSRETKMKFYKTLIRPVVTYAAETWTLNLADISALKVFERKIVRKIYGPCVRMAYGE